MIRSLCVVAVLAQAMAVQTQPPPVAVTGGITGRVIDRLGGVIPGANVFAIAPGIAATRVTKTDGGGAYRFAGVTSGNYQVIATMDGFDPTRLNRVVVGERIVEQPDLRLEIGTMCECVTFTDGYLEALALERGEVHGRVVDRLGNALPFATVRLTQRSGPNQIVSPVADKWPTLTDANGGFSFLELPGDYVLVVTYPGLEPEESRLTIVKQRKISIGNVTVETSTANDTGLTNERIRLGCRC